jgi:ABC-type Fe3+/spermidine/putrescine transport system ATPase subunit
VISLHEDRTLLRVGREEVTAGRSNFPLMPGEKVTMVIRPEKLAVAHGDPADPAQTTLPLSAPDTGQAQANGKPKATIPGRVLDSVFVGTDTRVYVSLKGGTELTALVRNIEEGQDFKKGERVTLSYDPADSRLLPAAQLGTADEPTNGNGEIKP